MSNVPRRAPVRVETQDGPWSVSVAETPHDPRSYSLYIKTPTHNLTLTRSAMEILDLDHKLRDADSQAKIPPLPFTADSIPQPPKRKSTFLNTLSRLASPARRNTTSPTSPSTEINDPFSSFDPSSFNTLSAAPTPSATSTGLAAYLTTISNSPTLRQTRVWKRFVRVRTDDLESVRTERTIKRVRSDLAAHVGGALPGQRDDLDQKDIVHSTDQPQPTVLDGPLEDLLSTPVQSPKELDDDGPRNESQAQATECTKPDTISHFVDEVKNKDSSTAAGTAALHLITTSEAAPPFTPISPEDIPVPTTPTASEPHAQAQAQAVAAGATTAPSQQLQQRIHRSQSADPDKSSRLSRAFAQSAPATNAAITPEMDGGMSSATGDESSVSMSTSKRKKRSKSAAPPREKKYKEKKSQRKVVIGDFEMMRVLGKGCAGKVLLVRHKPTLDLYALKAITKRHVLAHQELQHTLTEQAVLKRMAAEGKDPFVVKLWWSFHDKENLFLVMDFHPGGDLATQLARWGRLGRDRARFYAAEIVEGVEGLHAAGVIYRDLKPENILIGSDGHIVLTDFGLSKEFPRRSASVASVLGGASAPMTPQQEFTASAAWMRNGTGENGVAWHTQMPAPQDHTTTFCGTAEYLAPEVIQGLPYSYEVDWWSFGTMLYEMLTGITPFWANNHSDMYVRVLQDELQFPEDRAIDQDTKSLIRGLLQRNPALRICEPRIKRHPYFSMIDWSHVYFKRYIPPYIPPIDPGNASDTQNFDETFLDMEPVLDEYVADQEQDQEQTTDTDADLHTDTDRTDDGDDTATTPSQSRSSSIRPAIGQQQQGQLSSSVQSIGGGGNAVGGGGGGGGGVNEETVDVFDGYSFKGRHSVVIGSSDEEEGNEDEDEDEEEEEGSGSEMTGATVITTGTTTTESSETGDDSSVIGSAVSAVESIRPVEEEGEEVPEPKTPEARPIALQPATPVTPSPSKPVVTTVQVVVDRNERVPDDIQKLLKDAKDLEHKLEEGEPETPTEDKPRTGKTALPPIPEPPSPPPTVHQPPQYGQVQQQKNVLLRSAANKTKRRERSGIPALDKDLPEDTEAGEDTEAAGGLLDDEDDDWDFIDAVDGEDRNGAKGTSLFARGVVDRYRLAVFRKASTPSRTQPQQPSRSVSEASTKKKNSSEIGGADSPTQRRGRAGLAFGRKGPRQFLQPKNANRNTSTPVKSASPPPPPPSNSSRKSGGTKSFGPLSTKTSISSAATSMSPPQHHTRSSTTATTVSPVVTSSSAVGLLTPSLSMGSSAMMSMSMSPSLKSRESAASVGARSGESDQSLNGGTAAAAANGVNGGDMEAFGLGQNDELLNAAGLGVGAWGGGGSPAGAEKTKATAKKLKKYKEGAEKVFSLFAGASSPKQHHAS